MSLSRCFSYNGLTVRVLAGDAAHLAWLEEFLEPSFRPVQDGEARCTVALVTDDRSYDETLRLGPRGDGMRIDCFVLDSGVVSLPLWTSRADERVIFDERFKAFYCLERDRPAVRILSPCGNLDVRFALMRVVREFAMSASQTLDEFVIHAAAFSVMNEGIIIAGPKRAGKTTFLVHCLQASGARFISNDRVVVSLASTEPVLRGMPTLVSVRDGTLDLLPELQQPLLAARYDYRVALEERKAQGAPEAWSRRGDPFDLTPSQFCAVLGVRMSGHAPVRALLFPRISEESDGLRIRHLPARAALERLSTSLFGIRSPQPNSQAFFLSTDGPGGDPAGRERLCSALTARVPCFECELGRWAYREDTAVKNFLRHVLLR
jgi:hypothetical protein